MKIAARLIELISFGERYFASLVGFALIGAVAVGVVVPTSNAPAQSQSCDAETPCPPGYGCCEGTCITEYDD